jgi:hypothetical protein
MELVWRIHTAMQMLQQPWLPDLFAALYDVLDSDHMWHNIHPILDGELRGTIGLQRDEAAWRSIYWANDKSEWVRLESNDDFAARADRALVGLLDAVQQGGDVQPSDIIELAYVTRLIDRYLSKLATYEACATTPHLQDYWEQFAKTGSFTRVMDGKVIPRAVRGSGKPGFSQFLSSLIRVSDSEGAHTTYKQVTALPRRAAGSTLRVGFVPTIEHIDEMEWALGDHGYKARLAAAHEPRVVARALGALDWMTTHEADIVVFPEQVSSAGLRRAVRAWLKSGWPRPSLVVVGSEVVEDDGPTGHVNRAFVLNSAGELIWTQDKCHRDELSEDELKQFALGDIYDGAVREIGMATDKKIAIREVSGIGRVAVVICEDISRLHAGMDWMRAYGLNVCIAIALSGGPPTGSWVTSLGLNACRRYVEVMLVGNSRALLSRNKAIPVRRIDLADCEAKGTSAKHWQKFVTSVGSEPTGFLATVNL